MFFCIGDIKNDMVYTPGLTSTKPDDTLWYSAIKITEGLKVFVKACHEMVQLYGYQIGDSAYEYYKLPK